MNNEQQELVNEAYKSYENKYYKGEAFGYKKLNDSGYSPDLKLSQEEFINKCKTDTEFSEKWGLKIEERELSESERVQIYYKKHNKGRVGSKITKFVLDHDNIPTKLITITYNDKTIESYE
jgi:methylthioribose-1-phosphate isomerase